MAAAGEIKDLCEETTCPICLDYFRDPVIIAGCGHNFCQACITKCWEKKEDVDASCPQCREAFQDRSFIPNRPLANLVEIAKKLSLQGQGRARKAEGLCEQHQEPLKLFCKEHQAPICMVCDRSREHESHKVVPWEEAFQEYKDQICSRLKILRAEIEKIQMYKEDIEKESQELLNQTEEERQKTQTGFRQMHQFLEEQEKILLAQIEEVEKEITRRRDEQLARLSKELFSLENLIQEIEEKCQQPANELLQEIRSILQRSEKKVLKNPVAFPPELTCRIREFHNVKHHLQCAMEQFPANVKLDPDTAHPNLILSEDHKSMRCSEKCQDPPNNPQRFDRFPCVLGCEGFTAGRHFWDVTVGNEEGWAVGVVRKSVRRKGECDLNLKEGCWAVGNFLGEYNVVNFPNLIPVSFKQNLKRIRVTLDCAKGKVSFSDAETGVHIYTYSRASFSGETVLPYFYVRGKAHLRLSP